MRLLRFLMRVCPQCALIKTCLCAWPCGYDGCPSGGDGVVADHEMAPAPADKPTSQKGSEAP